MPRHAMLITVAAAAALGAAQLVACGGARVGSSAPQISTVTAAGDQFDLRDKRGTIVLIDFYANW